MTGPTDSPTGLLMQTDRRSAWRLAAAPHGPQVCDQPTRRRDGTRPFGRHRGPVVLERRYDHADRRFTCETCGGSTGWQHDRLTDHLYVPVLRRAWRACVRTWRSTR